MFCAESYFDREVYCVVYFFPILFVCSYSHSLAPRATVHCMLPNLVYFCSTCDVWRVKFFSCTGISHLPLLSSEMRSMLVHCGPQGPVVFLLMSVECGKRLRSILGMKDRCSGYYDPESDGTAPVLSFHLFVIVIVTADVTHKDSKKICQLNV